jgi:hypothetical protein
VRAIARTWSKLRLDWEVGRHRLPFFTQQVAVVLLGVLVATLALLGGVVALLGPPEAGGPEQVVPEDHGRPPARALPGARPWRRRRRRRRCRGSGRVAGRRRGGPTVVSTLLP